MKKLVWSWNFRSGLCFLVSQTVFLALYFKKSFIPFHSTAYRTLANEIMNMEGSFLFKSFKLFKMNQSNCDKSHKLNFISHFLLENHCFLQNECIFKQILSQIFSTAIKDQGLPKPWGYNDSIFQKHFNKNSFIIFVALCLYGYGTRHCKLHRNR